MSKPKQPAATSTELPRYVNISGYTVRCGCDPDIHKSGFAVKAAMKPIELFCLSFFEIFDALQDLILENERQNILVIIEAGWLNTKSNYHGHPKQSKAIGERIASKVGANAEAGRKIAEMCQYLGLAYQLRQPTTTKVTPAVFERITGIKTKSQERIDAAMLIL